MGTGKIQKIPGKFPVTVADAVYMNAGKEGGSNETLQDYMNNGRFLTSDNLSTALEVVMQENFGLLKTYKGFWSLSTYRTAAFRATCAKGDWWVHKGTDRQNIDASLLTPNGIVYFDGEFFKTIYVPYTNSVDRKPYYDVVIIGAGAGGIGAAYALRNSGWSVALIERLDTLGGTHCGGVGLYLPSPSLPWFQDLVRECFIEGLMTIIPRYNSTLKGVGPGTNFEKALRATQYGDDRGVLNSFKGNYVTNNDYKLAQKYYKDLTDAGIDVFINTELVKTNSKDGTVYSVSLRNTLTNETFEMAGDYFLDCSGDGVLYASDPNLKLDEDYYIGTDPASRFNETGPGMYAAGYPGDHNGINTVEPITYQAGIRYEQGFKFPPLPTKYKVFPDHESKDNFGYMPINEDVGIKSMSNSYGTGMKASNFIERSIEWNLQEGHARALSYFGTKSPYHAGSRFAGIRPLLSIREKYRVHAVKMLDAFWLQKQLTSANYVADRIIAANTWYPDIHTPDQNYAPASTIANGIPYDSMIPVAYPNVLVACKAFGVSHLAAIDLRLIKMIIDMGYAAGNAILQLLDSGTRGDVRTVDVPALQDKIRIAETIEELETYFYGPTVEFEELTSLT